MKTLYPARSEVNHILMTLLGSMVFSLRVIVLLNLYNCAFARDIVFPPIAGVDFYQAPLDLKNDVDIVTGSAFSGLSTFANLAYISCFEDKPDIEKYDIALLGAPFDTVSTSIPISYILFFLAAEYL